MNGSRYFKPKPRAKAPRAYHYRPPAANHPLLLRAPLSAKAADPAALPAAVDLRNMCLPVRDQGQEGACSGFATAAFRELSHAAAAGAVLPGWLSPAYLYAKSRMNNGSFPADSGASVADEFDVLQNLGVSPEAFMPFSGDPSEGPSAAADMAAVPFRITQPLSDANDRAALKTALAKKQAIAIGIYLYESFEHPDAEGVLAIPNPETEAMISGHCLLVCGYDDARSWWVIRNQYGPGWGAGGYCFMPYGYESFWVQAWTAAPQI